MQSSGQYGVPDAIPQFVSGSGGVPPAIGGRSQQQPPTPHMFSSLAREMTMSPSSSSSSVGHGHVIPHHHHHHQQQHQQYQLQQHHHHHQQQQQQQLLPTTQHHHHHHHQTHHDFQHPNTSSHLQQHHLHQQQQQLQMQQHHEQFPQQQQQQQQKMVELLGLGEPDSSSPEQQPPPLPPPPMPLPIASRPTLGTFQQLLSGDSLYNEEEEEEEDVVVVAAEGGEGGGGGSGGQDEDGLEGGEEEGKSTGGRNQWPTQETLALIQIRSEMDADFRDAGLKAPLWEELAQRLRELGYNRSGKKCKEKFENIYKYYKKTKDGKVGRQDGKNYRFFSQLDALYGSGGGRGGGGSGHNKMMVQGGDGGVNLAVTGHGGSSSAVHVVSLSAAQRIAAAAEDSEGHGPLLNSSEDNDEDEEEEAGGDDAVDQEENEKMKHKDRKLESSSDVLFLESVVKKLLDKQENMQRKFLESMEQYEEDRLAREESWRKQEMARLGREHEFRIQEHSVAATRDAALVAFLQKVTGQTLELPKIPSPPHPLIVVTTGENQQQQQQQQQQQHPLQEDPERDGMYDPNSKRWPKPEVETLIQLRGDLESKFQEAGPKGMLWEEISAGMTCLGYDRNAKRCKEKWENINKYYRKAKESNKKRSESAKTCPYFQQLDALYGNGTLGTQQSGKTDKDQLEELHGDRYQVASRDTQDESGPIEGIDGPFTRLAAGAASSASNGVPAHLFSSPENGISGNQGKSKKAKRIP